MFSFPKSLLVCLPNRHSYRPPPVQQAHCRRMTAEFSPVCSASRLFKERTASKKGTLIHVGARAARHKGNAAPSFVQCLPKLLFHKFRGIFSKIQKSIIFLRSLRRTSGSPPHTFSGCPRKATFFRRVVFLGFSRVGKTLTENTSVCFK